MLARFLSALGQWIDRFGADDRARVHLRYCGSGVEMVRQALVDHPLTCPVEITGNVAHGELARICQGAMANCYLWAPFTFHHKMLELLSTRWPTISFPGEQDESVRLAATVGGELLACKSEDELTAAIDVMWDRWQRKDLAGSSVNVSAFSWDAGAEKLEAIFEAAISHHLAPVQSKWLRRFAIL